MISRVKYTESIYLGIGHWDLLVIRASIIVLPCMRSSLSLTCAVKNT